MDMVFASMPAYPLSYKQQQPDGTFIYLRMNGDLEFHYLSDSLGYPVVETENKWSVYAQHNSETGQFEPSDVPVGKFDPSKMGLERFTGAIPSPKENTSASYEHWHHEWNQNSKNYKMKQKRKRDKFRTVESISANPLEQQIKVDIMKNLVVLVCFADHDIHMLPSPQDYDDVFNSNGPSFLAATGSVRDVYTTSSYGQFQIESVIYPWIQLSQTESYYANGNAGGSSIIHDALIEALNVIDSDPSFDWDDFDRDKDHIIDSITFLHSGYGAEFGGRDCRNKNWRHRIWSHMWTLSVPWESQRRHVNLKVEEYQLASALWGINQYECYFDVMHIGVISHEIAHFLGLSDQYGGSIGVGIGSYGLMGNAWGADFSQRYPPIMSPWNKIELGWIEPIEISKSGIYEITASYNTPTIYIIRDGYKKNEYLLIENRQPQLFDKTIAQGGLLIWHVDEKAKLENDGSPNQVDWPQNGNHYINALLQADGKYNLETGLNYGDAFDAFHANGVDYIGPDGTSVSDYPNTDSYQSGKVKRTGHVIDRISISADSMTFRFIHGKDESKYGGAYIFGTDHGNENVKLKNKGTKKKSKRIKRRRFVS